MMGVVLRGGLSRSVGVSTGLALDVPGVDGRLWNELSTRRDPGHGVARKRRTPEATVVVIRSAHRGRHVTPTRRFSDGHNDWD
jgi:hypothetical protein